MLLDWVGTKDLSTFFYSHNPIKTPTKLTSILRSAPEMLIAFSANLSIYSLSYKLGDLVRMHGKMMSENAEMLMRLLICGSNESKV